MPIRIDYTPVGAALNLARIAGEGAGYQSAFQQDLQLIGLAQAQQAASEERRARDQAFALQQAMAGRVAGTPTARPTAQYFPSRSQLYSQTPQAQAQAEQQAQMQQLDRMLAQGTIDQAVYEQNKLRLLSGATPYFPNAPTVKEPPLSVRRQPYSDARSRIQRELNVVEDWLGVTNPEESPWGSEAGIRKHQQELFAELDRITQEERRAFGVYDPVSGASTEAGESRTLTPEIINQILDEAGGDPDKAEEIARSRGYEF